MAKRKAPRSVRFRVHTRYYLEDGPVGGVTTLIKKQKENPALVHAAWKLGLEEIDYREEWKFQANIGTLSHDMARYHFMGFDEGTEEWKGMLREHPAARIEIAENCYLAILDFLERNHFIPILVEQPLVSRKHRAGGTLDTFGLLNGLRTLLDIKTSKFNQRIGTAVYPDMWVQVAGYEDILEEIWKYKYRYWAPKKQEWNTGDIQAAIRKALKENGHKITSAQKLVENRMILHLDKETGNFTPYPAPDLMNHHKLFTMQAKSYPVWRMVYAQDKADYWSKRRKK